MCLIPVGGSLLIGLIIIVIIIIYVFIYLFLLILIVLLLLLLLLLLLFLLLLLLLELFIGKDFLAKVQLHKVSKNNITSNSGALPQNDKIKKYYTSS